MSAERLPAVEVAPVRRSRGLAGWIRFAIGVPVAWLLGAVACGSAVTATLALGFALRWMSRTSDRVWWRQSARSVPFDVAAPRWVLAAEPGWRGWIGGLLDTARVGVLGSVHTLLALLPSAVLWMFAWRYGWDTSFTKGYDLRWIGPVLGLLGIGLFAITMLGLPLAQARYAKTRSWRAFWDVGLLARLVRRSWTGAVPLAALHALVGVPFTVMWMVPVFAPIRDPSLLDLTRPELVEWLRAYYFRWALVGFPVFFGLKMLAARWYGHALLDAVRSGTIPKRQLHPAEIGTLEAYDLLRVKDLSHRHPLVRAADWTASALGRTAGLGAAMVLWALVASQVFVGNFFHYRPIVGWVGPPMVAIPAFVHIPAGLAEADEE